MSEMVEIVQETGVDLVNWELSTLGNCYKEKEILLREAIIGN